MAEAIARQAAGGKVDVVGFSIGGFIALQVCRLLGDSVRSLHLVSAAAPPEVDGLINMAAGKFVFRLARSRSTAFRMLSRLHGWTAFIAPGLVFRAMFVGAKGEDKSMTTDGRFRDRITGMLQSSLGHHAQGYARDILAYVRPWKETLAQITVDTYLWHGSEDNWSPVAMAQYLQSAIPGYASTRIFDGLSHYSCLYRAAPEICRQLGVGYKDAQE